MEATGANVERITFNGNFNASPNISFDGKFMAYISRVGGAFKLHVMDLRSGIVTPITDTQSDEKPSFASNGRQLLYATQQDGQSVLMVTTTDGKT